MGSLRTDEVEVRIIFDIGLGWRSLARCERARVIIEYVRTRLPNLSPGPGRCRARPVI